MNITLVHATPEHLETVQALNRKLFELEHIDYDNSLRPSWPYEEEGTAYFTKRITEQDGFVMVAKHDETIVGYFCGGVIQSEGFRNLQAVAELENMYIEPDWRNKGIGTQLVDSFLEWCTNKKIQRIRVVASSNNKRAIQFYRRHGFDEYSLALEKHL